MRDDQAIVVEEKWIMYSEVSDVYLLLVGNGEKDDALPQLW
jgi:hypothetical protein